MAEANIQAPNFGFDAPTLADELAAMGEIISHLASKKDDDDRIDKIGQTCLQNEAPRRRINVRTPIKSNKDTGAGNIRPLPTFLGNALQPRQEMFLKNQEKTTHSIW